MDVFHNSPDTTSVMVDGRPVTVGVAEVRIGDRLLVKPGERIPVEGYKVGLRG